MGPEGFKVPELSQGTGLGQKTYNDLVGADFRLTFSGNTIKASGEVKKVESWPEFSNVTDQQSGHYLPLTLPVKYLNQKVTVTGLSSKTQITLNGDTNLITRMEHISNNTSFTLKFQDDVQVTIDVSGCVQK